MEEKKRPGTFAVVTAVLCALVMLFSIITFFSSGLMFEINYLDEEIQDRKDMVSDYEMDIYDLNENIAEYQSNIESKEAEKADAETDLKTAEADVTKKQEELDKAEANLDKVCTRSYYSSLLCEGNCKSLHTAVTNCSDKLSDAKKLVTEHQERIEDIEDEIETLNGSITRAEEQIERCEGYIEELEEEIKDLRGDLAAAWFILILKTAATVLALAGLALLTKNFCDYQINQNMVFFAVLALAASSAASLLIEMLDETLFYDAMILFNPHIWNLGAMILLAVILRGNTTAPVALRNAAIVLLVISGLTTMVYGGILAGIPYAAAMICAAFVIVPLVFTEYIDIAKHIFLSLITCGIWLLVWIFHVTKNLNKVEAVEERAPGRELALCLFLPFYDLYWIYKTAESVEDYGMEKGKQFKIDVLCIALSFVCPLFATVMIQNKINVIVGKPVVEVSEPLEIAE